MVRRTLVRRSGARITFPHTHTGVALQLARSNGFARLCQTIGSDRATQSTATNVARLFHTFSQLAPRAVVPLLMARFGDGGDGTPVRTLVSMCKPDSVGGTDHRERVQFALNAISTLADHGDMVSGGVPLSEMLVSAGAVEYCVHHSMDVRAQGTAMRTGCVGL